MDLIDQLNQIAARIPQQMEHITTEEATKNALVLPMLNALGYNVFDPTEVVPEFTADVGTKKGEKVDYVLMRNGSPAVLIECKPAGSKLNLNHAAQLFRYFSVTEARFAVLTNGIDYQIFTDIDAPNKMDNKPFFEFSMLRLDAKDAEQLRKFSKSAFNLENILSDASELRYKNEVMDLLAQYVDTPAEEFVRYFTKQVYSGTFTAAVKDQFATIVRDAFRELIRERVNQRLQSAINQDGVPNHDYEEPSNVPEEPDAGDEIATTDEEREGFQIVRAILSKHVAPKRVVMRDTKSYCGVLLDDNNRKPICRLRFNYSTKYIGLFDENKKEEKLSLATPTDIFLHEDQLIKTLGYYEQPKAEASD
jgi:predicted type IV restriction endonuclease